MPNCGFTRAAIAARTPASHHFREPAATSEPKSGSVPTASTCPQYGPAKITPGCSDQIADAAQQSDISIHSKLSILLSRSAAQRLCP